MVRGFKESGSRRPSSGASRSNSTRGRVRDGKAVQYSIKDSRGGTKYVGTTNNPRARAAQHKETGKLGQGDKFVVETHPIKRKVAERVEAAKIGSHRRQHGSNPTHNKTNDGRFH